MLSLSPELRLMLSRALRKIWKQATLVTCLLLCTLQVIEMSKHYFAYASISQISVTKEQVQEVPAITICSPGSDFSPSRKFSPPKLVSVLFKIEFEDGLNFRIDHRFREDRFIYALRACHTFYSKEMTSSLDSRSVELARFQMFNASARLRIPRAGKIINFWLILHEPRSRLFRNVNTEMMIVADYGLTVHFSASRYQTILLQPPYDTSCMDYRYLLRYESQDEQAQPESYHMIALS